MVNVAASALCHIGDPRALPVLLAEERKRYRAHKGSFGAIQNLHVFGLAAVDPLDKILRDKEAKQVWDSAVRALGKIHDPQAVPPIIEALKRGYAEGQVEYALIDLGPLAVEPLIDLLDQADLDKKPRECAERALRRITGRPQAERQKLSWRAWWTQNKQKVLDAYASPKD